MRKLIITNPDGKKFEFELSYEEHKQLIRKLAKDIINKEIEDAKSIEESEEHGASKEQ